MPERKEITFFSYIIIVFLSLFVFKAKAAEYEYGSVLRVKVTGYQKEDFKNFRALGEKGWSDFQRMDLSDFQTALKDTLVFVLPNGKVCFFWEKQPLELDSLTQESLKKLITESLFDVKVQRNQALRISVEAISDDAWISLCGEVNGGAHMLKLSKDIQLVDLLNKVGGLSRLSNKKMLMVNVNGYKKYRLKDLKRGDMVVPKNSVLVFAVEHY